VAEAAEVLGVTRDAIHKRIKRGSIEHEKGEDGRFYVDVDTSTPGLDASVDKSKDKSKVEVLERLIEGQQDRIESLERQLMRHGDETERLHQIIAGLAQANAEQARTIRAIEAPASEEPTQDAETVEEEPEGAEPRSATGSTQEATQRPWWRRMFGG
jgi:septal ring factor EnvC (AmiA/AmiB activator)